MKEVGIDSATLLDESSLSPTFEGNENEISVVKSYIEKIKLYLELN